MNHGSWSAHHVLTNIIYRRMSSKVKKVQNIFSTMIKPRSAWQVNTKRHLANHKNLTACFKYTSKYQVAFLVVTTQSTHDGTRPYTLYLQASARMSASLNSMSTEILGQFLISSHALNQLMVCHHIVASGLGLLKSDHLSRLNKFKKNIHNLSTLFTSKFKKYLIESHLAIFCEDSSYLTTFVLFSPRFGSSSLRFAPSFQMAFRKITAMVMRSNHGCIAIRTKTPSFWRTVSTSSARLFKSLVGILLSES